MPVKTYRPLTPSRRFLPVSSFAEITKSKPEKSLVVIRKKTGGRNAHGRVTARGIGGGHKQKIRLVDFKRRKTGMDATVASELPDGRFTIPASERPGLTGSAE